MNGKIILRPADCIVTIASSIGAVHKAYSGDFESASLLASVALYAFRAAFTITPTPTGEKE